ncbi:MAG: hypothetical protein KatS3mg015_1677 [Fimbriimonadales bacterium]|nr:MAG: hypothetical protein KatS3mg015_1677 [Fimbriimonadales bacterium]
MHASCEIIELLLQLQDRAFRSSPWHSLLGSLTGISEEVFNSTPRRFSGFPWMDGSIRSIVYHVTGDKLVQFSQAFGDGSVTWDSLSIAKSDLTTMLRELEAAHEPLVRTLRSLTQDDLSRKVRTWGGKKMTTLQFFLMLIEHDLYHAGQIRTMRNLLEEPRG